MVKIKTNLSQVSSNFTPNKDFIQIFPARVNFTILNNKTFPEAFEKFGGWDSIGGVLFSSINKTLPNNSKVSSFNFALPLFPNYKQPPLKNEIVYILSFPNNKIQEDVNSITYYYIHPLNLWNNPQHNAIPNTLNFSQPNYDNNPNPNNPSEESIDLGETFSENSNIRPLQAFEGDIYFEGRFGQSLRFGSTIKNSQIFNFWSKEGEDGDPITIFRNSQRTENKEAWIPQLEDINMDASMFIFTSTQKIPIKVSSSNYNSYQNPPTPTQEYNEPQIIYSSNRILLNAKTDSILLSAAKSINLNSKESINIDSPKFVAASNDVLLGDKDAIEPFIFGDKFLNDFKQLLQEIISLCKALQTPIGTPTPYKPNLKIPPPAVKLEVKASKMYNKIQSYKSKITKSK